MLITDSLRQAISAALASEGISVASDAIGLERPSRPEHGDWSTNVCLVMAKAAGRNPRDLAGVLQSQLTASPPSHVTAVEIAGPGFLNFRLAPSWLHEVLSDTVAAGTATFGRVTVPGARSVVVEFVSANPTGPLHAGHARWAAYGDALSRLLAHAGYTVHREFYVNDRGVQIQIYGDSLEARKKGLPVTTGMYEGAYVTEWAAEMPDDADPKQWGLDKAHRYQRDTMARMHVEFDTWSSERAIADSGAVEATLSELSQKGHTFEESGATWLRTTDFGDDKDRVLVKADGAYTYFTPDIAYHRDKFNRGDLLIDILGADHHGYVGRMKAAMQCLGHDRDDLEILIGQNCVLMRDGVEVKLSKRTGDIIELAEIIDEVGADATKFTFLLQSINTMQTVDLGLLVQTTLDNPIHYVHYAHARLHGIMREAEKRDIQRAEYSPSVWSPLVEPSELEIARMLNDFPAVVALAAQERAPHKVATWIRDLAGAIQSFHRNCPVLRSDVPEDVQQARLWLVEAARIGLATGLELLGVSAPTVMARLTDDNTADDNTDDSNADDSAVADSTDDSTSGDSVTV
jgi:arginyl-tRNA synthetase